MYRSLLPAVLLMCPGMLVAQSADATIVAVTHVDFMPDHLQSVAALEQYVARERRDAGVVRVDLLQQEGAGNHYTLVETFRDRAAYDAHSEAEYTRRFRAGIVDALGSPFDQRLFREAMPR